MRTRRARTWAAAATVGIVLGSGALALATIPAAGGTISGCFKNNSGDLRVIDVPAESCKNGETAIQWNQSGPRGAPGPQGTQGDPGPEGPPGATDNVFANVSPRLVDPDILLDVSGNHVVGAVAVSSPIASKVTFDRDVTDCAYAATGRDSLDRIRADRDPLDPNTVLVSTRLAGADNDGFGRFSLVVAC
jgi:hypothetical protein